MNKPVVFIIDDTPDNLGVLFSHLKSANFDVRVDTSSQSALDAIPHVQPDIILLDIILPDTDGYEVAKQIRSLQDKDEWTAIIFLSVMSKPDTTTISAPTKPLAKLRAILQP